MLLKNDPRFQLWEDIFPKTLEENRSQKFSFFVENFIANKSYLLKKTCF